MAYARQKAPNIELMADVATIDDVENAERLGFDYISTTLRGYTAGTKNAILPDVDFIAKVLKRIKKTKVVAEGGIYETGELKKISDLNPYAVVIGSAVTRPKVITERFCQALNLK